MELSMWDIYHSLDYENMVSMIQTGRPSIAKARLIASSYLDNETIYVGRANDFFEANADDSLIVHREDMILVRGVTIESVFDEICVILDDFNKWERSLEASISRVDGLQEMLDASAGILKAPAFVYAPDGRAFAISREYPSTIHWHWKEIVEGNGISSDRLRELRDSINLPEVWKDTYPKSRQSAMGPHEYMHCSLFPNGYMAGHLVVFGFEKPFDQGLARLVNILAVAMTKHMKQFYPRYSPTSKIGDAFSLFFEGGSFDEANILLYLRALRWNHDDTFRLYVMRERSDSEPVLLSQLYYTVTHRYPFVISFIFEDVLVVLENELRCESGESIAVELPSMMKGDFLCGVSNSFEGIEHCWTFFLQAKDELNESERTGRSFSRASEHGLAFFNRTFAADDLLYTYALPELVRLKRYDEANQTQFFETLYAYTYASFHLSDAARYLGIHRNSLDYRLKRIREIIDFSLFDKLLSVPDKDAFTYLMLSFAIVDAHGIKW